MTENRAREREEKEIDLIDLMLEIMLHWRGLILFMLIGGLLLGGYSYMKSYKAREAAKSAAAATAEATAKAESLILSDEEKLNKMIEEAQEIEKDLTATSVSNVETALLNFKQANDIQNYLDASVLMKADPYNIPSGDIIFNFFTDPGKENNIRVAYEGILSSADFFNHLKEKCGYGSEVFELVTVGEKVPNNSQNKNNIIQNENGNVVRVHCYASSEENCKKLTNAIEEYVKETAATLQGKLGYHEVFVISSSVSSGYDPIIAQTKADKEKQIYTNEASLARLVDAFSAQEKEYYTLKKNIEVLNGQIEAQIEEKANEIVIPQISISKKMLLIGLFAGLFVYAGIICIIYIFSQKIKDSDDFTSTFGAPQLGKLYGQRQFNGFGKKIDKWIYSLKSKGRKKISIEEATGIIAANTALSAAKAGIGKIGIICAGGMDEDESGLIGKITSAMKAENIEAKVLSQLLYSEDEAYSTKDLDAVVFVAAAGKSRYGEVWEAMEVIDNQKISVLGGIMA